jgi:hypothetical protein
VLIVEVGAADIVANVELAVVSDDATIAVVELDCAVVVGAIVPTLLLVLLLVVNGNIEDELKVNTTARMEINGL